MNHDDIFNQEPHFSFHTRIEANDFLKRIRDIAYKCDGVTVNDILKDRGIGLIPEGYQHGYSKKMLKNIKPKQEGSFWMVTLPRPGKLVRDIHGYWTVEGG